MLKFWSLKCEKIRSSVAKIKFELDIISTINIIIFYKLKYVSGIYLFGDEIYINRSGEDKA